MLTRERITQELSASLEELFEVPRDKITPEARMSALSARVRANEARTSSDANARRTAPQAIARRIVAGLVKS